MSALEAHQVMLDPENQALISRIRPLANYRLQFVNGRYPLLSLMYAIHAGGEHTLFCDHPDEFMRAYIVDSVSPEERPQAEEKLKTIKGLMKRLEEKRELQRRLPPSEQEVLDLDAEEWRLLGHIVATELTQKDAPMPMW
jgi:hypothetical protein